MYLIADQSSFKHRSSLEALDHHVTRVEVCDIAYGRHLSHPFSIILLSNLHPVSL